MSRPRVILNEVVIQNLQVQEEGTNIGDNRVSTINFTGAGVDISRSGNIVNAEVTSGDSEVLNVDTTTAGNTGAGEDNLKTYAIPANTLTVNGQSIISTCSGTYAANVNNKVIKIYFGSTLIFNSGSVSTSGAHWNLQTEVIRTGASTQKCVVVFNHSNISVGSVTYTTATENTTAGINLRVTGESLASASNDIVSEMFRVKLEAE